MPKLKQGNLSLSCSSHRYYDKAKTIDDSDRVIGSKRIRLWSSDFNFNWSQWLLNTEDLCSHNVLVITDKQTIGKRQRKRACRLLSVFCKRCMLLKVLIQEIVWGLSNHTLVTSSRSQVGKFTTLLVKNARLLKELLKLVLQKDWWLFRMKLVNKTSFSLH